MAQHQWAIAAGARRMTRRHRRLLAAAAAAASIAALGLALQPPQPPTRAVVVAAGDLPTGITLAPADLEVAAVPGGVLPDTTFTAAHQVVGRVLAAPLAAGEAVGGHRLTPAPVWSLPPGTMPLPVRFADGSAAGLLTAGQHVDVLAAGRPGLDVATTTPAELVAQRALVLSVISPDDDAGTFVASSQTESATLVVLAVPRATALAVAGAQTRADLRFVMHPSP